MTVINFLARDINNDFIKYGPALNYFIHNVKPSGPSVEVEEFEYLEQKLVGTIG